MSKLYPSPRNVTTIAHRLLINQKLCPKSVPYIISIVSGVVVSVCVGLSRDAGGLIGLRSLSSAKWGNARLSCRCGAGRRIRVLVGISWGGWGLISLGGRSDSRDVVRGGCSATAVRTIARRGVRGKWSPAHRSVGRHIHAWLVTVPHNRCRLALLEYRCRRSIALITRGLSAHITRGRGYYG